MAEKKHSTEPRSQATDETPEFTPKELLERFKQLTTPQRKIDIIPFKIVEDITDSGWTGKKQTIQEDFIWGVGPEALFQITRTEYETEWDSIKINDSFRLYTENFLQKRNTYHN